MVIASIHIFKRGFMAFSTTVLDKYLGRLIDAMPSVVTFGVDDFNMTTALIGKTTKVSVLPLEPSIIFIFQKSDFTTAPIPNGWYYYYILRT